MNLRVRDLLPGIVLLILIAVALAGTVVSGLPSGLESGVVVVLAMLQAGWIGIRYYQQEVRA